MKTSVSQPRTSIASATPLIEARGLRLVHNGREILAIDRFALRRGEVTALIGPNGAGKTSLLLTLAALQTPTAGELLWNGRGYAESRLIELRRRMAVVFQEPLLLDTTVERNLAFPLRMRGLSRGDARRRVRHWLERFGIAHLANRGIRHLSGGEAQRTSLARAFALEPDALFLDEPFSALDFHTRKGLLQDLGPTLREMQAAVLFVTHDYSELPLLASTAAVLDAGRITACGPLEDVLACLPS